MKRISNNLLQEVRKHKETINIEFKSAQGRDGLGAIPKDVYESVCSFSNRYGGNIYLGIDDNGSVLGVSSDRVEKMTKEFVSTIQSGVKIMPPLYLDIEPYEVDGKIILHILVPNSSQVHRMNGRVIYDRNNDADVDITNNTNLVQQMYTRKQSEYTENKIYPYVQIEDFKHSLIERVRKTSTDINGEHNLMDESDLEILKSLSMYRKDYLTGEEGFTLSGILTFGKDEIIHGVVPYFAIDVLLRIKDTERYDDRLRISTNLIDSYSQIMSFFAKYVSNPFYLKRDKRIELRDVLFREIVVNMLVHREYSNPFVSRVQIIKNEISFENANKPVHPGILRRGEIRPFPKNPNIAHVFHILGLVEELGSGLRKIFELSPILLGGEPIIDNEDHFTVSLPINKSGLSNLSDQYFSENKQQDYAYLSDEQRKVLNSLDHPMSTRELFDLIGASEWKSLNAFRTKVITPLLAENLIVRTIPSRPKSPKQKYVRSDTSID